MKKRLKMKRYEGGGDVDDDVEPEVIRRSYASGVRVKYEDEPAAKSKSAAKKEDDSYDRKEMRETSRASSPAAKSSGEDTGAATGRMLAKKDRRSAEEKSAENKYIRENITGPLVTSIGAGRVAKSAMEVGKAAKRIRDISQTAKAQELTPAEAARAARIRARSEMESMRQGKSFGDRDVGYKRGGSVGSASRRADGIAQRGKTKGRLI
jgi:hypothetical protein